MWLMVFEKPMEGPLYQEDAVETHID